MMLQDYLTVGLIGLISIGIPVALLGLPIYRRHAMLSWLETPTDDSLNTADSH